MLVKQAFTEIAEKLKKKSKITDANISEVLKESRNALIEADVALLVVKKFVAKVRSKVLGMQVKKSLNPGQQFLKILRQELIEALGQERVGLQLDKKVPAVILLVGLQGAGKTTFAAKLAKLISQRNKKNVLLTSVDTQRPAASEQLKILADSVAVDYFRDTDKKPVALAKSALKQAKKQAREVLIIDTAGRQTVDDELMAEIKAIAKTVDPVETLFVLDSMTGQDAVRSAQAFHQNLNLSGTVFTKMDSETRGGAILSVKTIAGVPVKYLGVGEKVEDIDVFYPERVADNILGMGDVFNLIEKAESSIDQSTAKKMLKKFQGGSQFNFNDMVLQFEQIDKIGGFDSVLDKLPGMANMASVLDQQNVVSQQKKFKAMIGSMTKAEKLMTVDINSSRKRRIVKGSGCSIQDFSRLMKQMKNMTKMSKKGSGGMKKMLNRLSGTMPNNTNSQDMMQQLNSLQSQMDGSDKK